MNSRDYWAQREEEALRHYIRDEAEYDRQIRRIYTDMLDACQRDIESFYSRYAGAEGITIAEAKKRVSQADIAAYERKAAKYVREKNFSKQANEEMRLYNATMRINRMEMLRANIGLELIAGHDELNNLMGEILQGRTMEELERMSGILGETVRHNTRKAAAIVNGSFHNGTFSDRIWQYQDLMREDLGKLLQQGLIQGKNPRALTKDLRKYLIGDKSGKGATYNVERLMRTELCRVQTEAQKQSYERNGFELYRFICNVHPSKSDTCDICKRIAAKDNGNGAGIYLVKDMMPGLNAPPVHPNCRCGTAEAVESEEEHEAWLDWLESGGTTAEWKATGRAQWKATGKAEWKGKRDNKIALAKRNGEDYNASKRDDLASLSLRFLSNRDTLYQNLQNVPPLDGYEDIACHADPHKFGFVEPETDETVQEVDAKFLVRRILESGKYNGDPVRLIACEAGQLDDGLAQQFANEIGERVLAPTKRVFVNSQGYMVLADTNKEAAALIRKATEKWNPDGWRIFEPREE